MTGPGGVYDSAREIAKFLDEAWIQLLEPMGGQTKVISKEGSWPYIKVFWKEANQ